MIRTPVTYRERRVLEHLAAGRSLPELAPIEGLTYDQARYTAGEIRRKFGSATLIGAVAKWTREHCGCHTERA